MDNINSVDIVQMSMALYAFRKAQSIQEDAGKTLIQKTLQDVEKNNKNNKELQKELFPWLGQNIDIMI
jgi:hypothetical protein